MQTIDLLTQVNWPSFLEGQFRQAPLNDDTLFIARNLESPVYITWESSETAETISINSQAINSSLEATLPSGTTFMALFTAEALYFPEPEKLLSDILDLLNARLATAAEDYRAENPSEITFDKAKLIGYFNYLKSCIPQGILSQNDQETWNQKLTELMDFISAQTAIVQVIPDLSKDYTPFQSEQNLSSAFGTRVYQIFSGLRNIGLVLAPAKHLISIFGDLKFYGIPDSDLEQIFSEIISLARNNSSGLITNL